MSQIHMSAMFFYSLWNSHSRRWDQLQMYDIPIS